MKINKMFVSGNITMQICATSNSELHINNSNGNVNITLSSFQKTILTFHLLMVVIKIFIIRQDNMIYRERYLL